MCSTARSAHRIAPKSSPPTHNALVAAAEDSEAKDDGVRLFTVTAVSAVEAYYIKIRDCARLLARAPVSASNSLPPYRHTGPCTRCKMRAQCACAEALSGGVGVSPRLPRCG